MYVYMSTPQNHKIRTFDSSDSLCSRQGSHLLPLFRILAGADRCRIGNDVLALLQSAPATSHR